MRIETRSLTKHFGDGRPVLRGIGFFNGIHMLPIADKRLERRFHYED